jgi:hypothetical protein
MTMDGHDIADACVLKERVGFFAKLNRKLSILSTDLVVVAVAPEDTDSGEVLLQFRSGSHVGTCEETEAAGIDFEALINGELTGKINSTLGELFVDFVPMGKRSGEK